jgi:hypothetical protein
MGRWCFLMDLSLTDFSAVASRIYELYYLYLYHLSRFCSFLLKISSWSENLISFLLGNSAADSLKTTNVFEVGVDNTKGVKRVDLLYCLKGSYAHGVYDPSDIRRPVYLLLLCAQTR